MLMLMRRHAIAVAVAVVVALVVLHSYFKYYYSDRWHVEDIWKGVAAVTYLSQFS